MNHLNINPKVVASWLKKKGWRRSKDSLGRLIFIDWISREAFCPEIAVEMQMRRELERKTNE